MKTTPAALSLRHAASTLLFALLCAAIPAGAGCAADVEGGGGDGGQGGGSSSQEASCQLGTTRPCARPGDFPSNPTGSQSCIEVDHKLKWGDCGTSSSSTPLVISFDARPVEFSSAMGGAFDLTGTQLSVTTDWPTAATPWLALDRNGNGVIDGGEELFGSASVLRSGARADNGFTALRELDSDGDGRITARDDAWSRLVLWSDRNGNRASEPSELEPLSARGVTAIDLAYARSPRCDGRGNCEIERAGFAYADARGALQTGAIVDVHLRWQ